MGFDTISCLIGIVLFRGHGEGKSLETHPYFDFDNRHSFYESYILSPATDIDLRSVSWSGPPAHSRSVPGLPFTEFSAIPVPFRWFTHPNFRPNFSFSFFLCPHTFQSKVTMTLSSFCATFLSERQRLQGTIFPFFPHNTFFFVFSPRRNNVPGLYSVHLA